MKSHVKVGRTVYPNGKSTSDHRTPVDLFEQMSSEVGGFDLDAAASDENHLVDNYFTIRDNALSDLNEWRGKVWCNPPYNNTIEWVKKAHFESGHSIFNESHASIVWMLLPVRSCTRWFHEWVMPFASEIRFIKGRLTFTGPNQLDNNSAPFGSMLVRFGGPVAEPRIVAANKQGVVA